MKNTILKKENGVILEFEAIDDITKLVKKSCPKTICFDCENARACKCEKIEDEAYKEISEYDFITDGYQLYDKNNEVKSFVVSKCNNYKKDEPRKRPTTLEELEHLRYLKESIKILFFDAENIDEADQIQEDLRNRHQIYDYDAYSLTDRKTR